MAEPAACLPEIPPPVGQPVSEGDDDHAGLREKVWEANAQSRANLLLKSGGSW